MNNETTEKVYYKVVCDALEIEYKYTSLRTAKSVASRLVKKHANDASCENIVAEVIEYIHTYKGDNIIKTSHRLLTSYE